MSKVAENKNETRLRRRLGPQLEEYLQKRRQQFENEVDNPAGTEPSSSLPLSLDLIVIGMALVVLAVVLYLDYQINVLEKLPKLLMYLVDPNIPQP